MRTLLVVAVSLALVACGQGTPGAEGGEARSIADHRFDDPEVTRVHQRMISTIAPGGGWEQARYLEFDWGANRGEGEPLIRAHRWDRWQGLARVEAPTQDGATMIAIFDTDDPESGRVWLDGVELSGEDAADRLRGAHRAHINDSYWLIMPYKWTDPGVHARYLGEQTDEEGRRWEVVELSFDDGTGLTPQNMYHAFVNPESGRMERWHHYSNAEADPSPSDWVAWTGFGPIELALDRVSGGQVRLFFSNVQVGTSVPDSAFDPPVQ